MRTVKSIRASLNRLPTTLNETYANILRRVEDDDVELLRRALVWTAFSVMPLTLYELQEAIAIDPGVKTHHEVEESRLNDPRDILSLGSSLLSVTETGHVKLAHLSVLDYLQSTEIQDSDVSVFKMSPGSANSELAMSCLSYLSLDSLSSGPVGSQSAWEARCVQHPLFGHAAVGWSYYRRSSLKNHELDSLVYELFTESSRPKFLSWIQVLNSDWTDPVYTWDSYPRHATPLHYAASFGLGDVVERLIEDGAELDAPGSRNGGTALHGATLRQHVSVMKILLKAGADPSRADFNMATPLHTAASYGNPEVLRLLLQYGASIEAEDNLGETPYMWALRAEQQTSQKLLSREDYDENHVLPRRRQGQKYKRFATVAVDHGLSDSFSLTTR